GEFIVRLILAVLYNIVVKLVSYSANSLSAFLCCWWRRFRQLSSIMVVQKRNKVVTIQQSQQFQLACLIFIMMIILMKIVPYTTCHRLTVRVGGNSANTTALLNSIRDFWPCSEKPNCFYQKNSINCTKMTNIKITLNFTDGVGLKPPPLMAALSFAIKKYNEKVLNGAYIEMNKNKPLELILCDTNSDILKWETGYR
ncbi:hypothetical protein ACI65C_004151, partial [Semiaphis heraclei]